MPTLRTLNDWVEVYFITYIFIYLFSFLAGVEVFID